jgi:S-DNA-T family DNA segregation ATPase FtsK/SpoIIIE
MQKLASRKKSDHVTSSDGQIAKLLKEAFKLLSISIAIFLYIALISYNKADSGWSQSGYETAIQNAAGYAGAWFSDLFLYIFGYLAYFFPLMLIYVTFQFVKNQSSKNLNYNLLSLRLLGLLLIVLSSSAIISLLILEPSEHLPFSSGGVLGDFIGFGVMEVFNFIGSLIILFTCGLIGITLLSGLSWFELGNLVLDHCMKLLKKGTCLITSKYSQFNKTFHSWSKKKDETNKKNKPRNIPIIKNNLDQKVTFKEN